MNRLVYILIGLVMASPLVAQDDDASPSVLGCDYWGKARNLAEPWEDNSRTFANGAVRLAIIDQKFPPVMPYHIMVLSPPYDADGVRQCRVISSIVGVGFGKVDLNALQSSYDPKRGLSFEVPVDAYLSLEQQYVTWVLNFSINQATGEVLAGFDPN